MVRSENWRYVEYGPEGANGALLFDIHADPYEIHNLADDPKHAPIRARLSPLVRAYAANLAKTQPA